MLHPLDETGLVIQSESVLGTAVELRLGDLFGPDGLAVGAVTSAPALGELRADEQASAALVPSVRLAQVRCAGTGVVGLAGEGARARRLPSASGMVAWA
ncbi:hypothetical protein GCM10011579_082770 [Streptomyces albiflavescens]|uniref:Uncharacterized protein n=1 Tax=Streptomyces albiflavescens TaxID=1623582 RepID=A0A918D900_9ACTN|nr:hypothetical protein GCM10011579_082770 [Streptomyces albiflavescens]